MIHFWRYLALQAVRRIDEAWAMLERAHTGLTGALADLTPDQRDQALLSVPEHRSIVEAWSATQPLILTVLLPALEAPTGRPLREDEWVEVAWTIDEPTDRAVTDPVARRRGRLVRLMREARDQGGAPTVEDLASALEVSRTTVRRDLASLRQLGEPVFTRGSRSA